MLTMKTLFDQVYDSKSGVSLRYDLFMPETEELLPVVICIHGGGWVSGEKSDMQDIAMFFAQNGFAAACPEYRLAPLYNYPAAVDDCKSFVHFLRANASKLGLSKNHIGSIGNSAGGYLSTFLSICHNEFNEGEDCQVNASVDIAGLVDLTNPREKHPAISWDFIDQYMGCSYEGNELIWSEASPLYAVTPNASPILIFHGSQDDIVWPDQSLRLNEAYKEVGVESELVLLEGEGHSYSEEAIQTILAGSLKFFKRHFQ
jgi:acetyl esterase/lipase